MKELIITKKKRPRHLYSEAVSKYEQLLEQCAELRDGDEDLLAVLANSYIDYEKAHVVLMERGPVLAGETMVRQNPAFGVVKDCAKMIETLCKHFGFSPKSRGERLDKTRYVPDELDAIL